MKNILSSISLFLLSAVSFTQAQTLVYHDTPSFAITDTNEMLMGRMNQTDNRLEIKGTPYLSTTPYEVKNIGNYALDFKKLKYNAYLDEFEFEKEGNTYILNRMKDMKIYFEYPITIFQLVDYNYKGKSIEGYLNLLVDNENIALYKKSKIIIDSKATSGVFAVEVNNRQSQKYVKLNDVYFIKKEGQIIEFPKNVKKFFNNEVLDKYIKDNKLNTSNEMDKIKLINFLNSL